MKPDFESLRLKAAHVPQISRVLAGLTSRIALAVRTAGPNALRRSESQISEQRVNGPAVVQRLAIGIVEDRKRELLAFRPFDRHTHQVSSPRCRERYAAIELIVPKFAMDQA